MAAAILKTYDLGYRQQRELAVADNQCVILRDKDGSRSIQLTPSR